MSKDNFIKEKSKEEIYEKHTGANMEMEYLPTPKANILAAMDEYAEIRAVTFVQFVHEFKVETRSKYSLAAVSPNKKEFLRRIRLTRQELYALFIKETENK